MDVTRKNFKEALPLVIDSIEKADFFSIDAEFTGLTSGPEVSIFDTAQNYCMRLMSGASEFLLIQFGLCAFYWDEKKGHYMHHAYNFYLFPNGRHGLDKMFLCQSSSLGFLAANGFDFNKLIRDGISYLTEPTETRLKENLMERLQVKLKEKDPVKIPDENKQQIEDICNKVKDFIENSKENEMEIDKCNAFVRMLLFQELRARFGEQVIVDSKSLENKNRVLLITRKTPDMEDYDTIKKKRELDEIDEAVGFTKVMRILSQSGKLVVGHNMLLDVIHTLSHFFQPIPKDYIAFKEFTHCMFPKLLDTKYMASSANSEVKGFTILQDMLDRLRQEPYSLPDIGYEEGRGYSDVEHKHHEAGYDAYITGLCFLSMYSYLMREKRENKVKSIRVDIESKALKPVLNKIFLSRTARQDSPYVNLDGPDPTPSRDHVFHLQFPKEWQRSDISQLFSPFGSIMVQFINETSAFVGLDRREEAEKALRVLSMHPRITLTPYHTYKKAEFEMQRETERPRRDPYKIINTPERKTRQVASNISAPKTPPELPQKVNRERSNSVTLSSPAANEKKDEKSRKRTSSGVFQVDESEPLPKKPEITPPSTEKSRKKSEVSNGRRKTADKVKSSEEKRDKVIEKFDSDAKSSCVSAFKESDSWD